jgi:hypothetical protein
LPDGIVIGFTKDFVVQKSANFGIAVHRKYLPQFFLRDTVPVYGRPIDVFVSDIKIAELFRFHSLR